MTQRSKLIIIVFALLIATINFSKSSIALAQQATLPDSWCTQPSDTQLTYYSNYSNYSWTRAIGVSEGGIRAVYQSYNNRIVLQRTTPREVVQVIQENVSLSLFESLRYTDNCRYLIARQRDSAGVYSIAVYDLQSPSSGLMGTIPDSGRNRWTNESSPDGTYLLVTAMDGLYLWNLNTNTQVHLTTLIRSDCQIASIIGCNGGLSNYREARWDVPHNLLQLDLVNNYTITLNLPDASINRTESTYHETTPDRAATGAAQYASDYSCTPKVQYQTYNHRIVLKDWLNGELLTVIQDDLNLSGFQFLGWSATCNYIAAAIQDTSGLRLVVWNVSDKSAQERAISDWVDHASWEATGDVLDVRTDHEQFEWDMNN